MIHLLLAVIYIAFISLALPGVLALPFCEGTASPSS